MKSFNFAAPFVLLSVPFVFSQDSAPQNELAQRVQHLMDVQVGFERMVPAGMSIKAQEISRTGESGKNLVVRYHIFVQSVPSDTLFRQIEWPVNAEKPSSPLWGISVGKGGILMCAGRAPEDCGDPKKPDDPIEFITTPRKGEPARFAFVAPNIKIGIVIVPDPITSSDGGCTLSAVRLTSGFELAFLFGSGYPPTTDIHYRVFSETTNDEVVRSDDTGKIRAGLIPHTGNKDKGTVHVKIQGQKCSPELSYEWGTI
jgi:hypothetical protein